MLLQTIPEQPLEMMDKYTVAWVGLVALSLLAMILIRYIIKRLKKQEEKIDSLIDKLIEEKDDSGKILSPDLSKFAERANKVQVLTYHLLNEFNADRFQVFEFHNGGKTLTGVQFKKCSNTYEAVELGIDAKSKDFQNIPISTNFLWNKLILSKEPIIISDAEELKETDKTIYEMLKSHGIGAYYSRLILDYDNKPIGFVVAEYFSRAYIMNEEQLKLFKESTITISGLINKN
jgi:hypothetical protein